MSCGLNIKLTNKNIHLQHFGELFGSDHLTLSDWKSALEKNGEYSEIRL